jgi:hypothetical protein
MAAPRCTTLPPASGPASHLRDRPSPPPNPPGLHPQDPVTNLINLSADNRALYQACFESGIRPSKIACTDAESKCFECYCYDSITAGDYT